MHGKDIDSKQKKLESEQRLQELKPEQNLRRFGISSRSIVCDIGAGTGVFTLPAARLSSNSVYALDIDLEMLERLEANAKKEQITNIKTILVEDDRLAIADDLVDLTLMVTVLHEIENKATIISEVKRISAPKARVAVIDFYPGETPNGPPQEERLAEEEVEQMFAQAGFLLAERSKISDNLYFLVFSV